MWLGLASAWSYLNFKLKPLGLEIDISICNFSRSKNLRFFINPTTRSRDPAEKHLIGWFDQNKNCASCAILVWHSWRSFRVTCFNKSRDQI